jgi:hypothetical protein
MVCPHCSETIQAAAKKCKHCGESVPTKRIRTSYSKFIPSRRFILLAIAPLALLVVGGSAFVLQRPKGVKLTVQAADFGKATTRASSLVYGHRPASTGIREAINQGRDIEMLEQAFDAKRVSSNGIDILAVANGASYIRNEIVVLYVHNGSTEQIVLDSHDVNTDKTAACFTTNGRRVSATKDELVQDNRAACRACRHNDIRIAPGETREVHAVFDIRRPQLVKCAFFNLPRVGDVLDVRLPEQD